MTTALLIGCGKMGGALLSGWLDSGIFKKVDIIDHQCPPFVEGNEDCLTWFSDIKSISSQVYDVIVLAVKPQQMDEIIRDCIPFLGEHTVIVSVAIGKSFSYFAKHLGDDIAIVRAMPNLPSAIRRGVTVVCAGEKVSEAQLKLARTAMEAVGIVEDAATEAQISSAAAISGGAPAYVFLLAECLIQAAIDEGFARDVAARMVFETIAGAGEMLHQALSTVDDLAEHPKVLRQNVSSPGGSTLQALRVFMEEYNLKSITKEAVLSAKKRCLELEKESLS